MAGEGGWMDHLQQLHTASQDLDRLAHQAQAGDPASRGQLVEGMGHWVQLVQGFVDRCPAGPARTSYEAATQELEGALHTLNHSEQPDEVTRLGQELEGIVERWSQALTGVLAEVLKPR